MTHITKISPRGLSLIKHFESLQTTSYKCPAGVWTIGYGTTRYPDGRRVAANETCTEEQADTYLLFDVAVFELGVDALTRDDITQSQFDALVSFAYNLGTNALRSSTLLKKVNQNPDDPSIRAEFLKWVNAGGKKLKGLVARRTAESDLYFSPK